MNTNNRSKLATAFVAAGGALAAALPAAASPGFGSGGRGRAACDAEERPDDEDHPSTPT